MMQRERDRERERARGGDNVYLLIDGISGLYRLSICILNV